MADLEIPDGFALQGAAQIPDGFTLAPTYRGSVLPFSTDAQGNPHLDWSAGLPGRMWNAVTAPGRVYSGETPINDPSLLGNATDAAAFFSPMGPRTSITPSAAQLRTTAGAGYDAARASGLDISGDAISNMASGLQNKLTADKGIIEKTAPKTWGLLDELSNPPQGGFVGVPGLMAAKSGLSNLSLEPGTEGLAARMALGGMRDFMSTLDNSSLAQTATGAAPATGPAAIAQTIRDADANYAAAQRSNALTGTLDRANTGIEERAEARAHASHSGANIDNAIRQRVASFLQNPENVAGFSQPEIDALNGLVQGGAVQNAARRVGNLFGGGGGLGQLAAGIGGAMVGSHALGPEGGALGAMVPTALGVSAKALENSLARSRLNAVDELIRQRSPLYNGMQDQGLLTQPPGLGGPAWRGFLPGMLSPTPAVPGATPGQPVPIGLLGGWA